MWHYGVYVFAVFVLWLSYEYHNLVILDPWFEYRASLLLHHAPKGDGPSTPLPLLFQITLPCITWRDDEEIPTPPDECERQSHRLEDLFRTTEYPFLSYSERAARLYNAPSSINLLWAELHSWTILHDNDGVGREVSSGIDNADEDTPGHTVRQLGSLGGPIVALQSLEQARDLVHQLKQLLAGIPQQRQQQHETTDVVQGPSWNVNLHATLLGESTRRPVLFTRIRHNRGWLTMYKAAIYLNWAARAPPRVDDLARAHHHQVDGDHFAHVFLEHVVPAAPGEVPSEDIQFIDLWILLQAREKF